jgi:hypothetical protein
VRGLVLLIRIRSKLVDTDQVFVNVDAMPKREEELVNSVLQVGRDDEQSVSTVSAKLGTRRTSEQLTPSFSFFCSSTNLLHASTHREEYGSGPAINFCGKALPADRARVAGGPKQFSRCSPEPRADACPVSLLLTLTMKVSRR